jgi:hypothetical protein
MSAHVEEYAALKCKVNFLCAQLIKHYAMETYGAVNNIDPRFLDLDNSWE